MDELRKRRRFGGNLGSENEVSEVVKRTCPKCLTVFTDGYEMHMHVDKQISAMAVAFRDALMEISSLCTHEEEACFCAANMAVIARYSLVDKPCQ